MTLFDGFDLDGAIRAAGAALGESLAEGAVASLAAHARAVAAANERLHLTAIRDPAAFVERHVAESLAGATLLEADVHGTLVDLGSGNGYPGIPLAVARPGLRAVLVESSPRKAEFLAAALDRSNLPHARVLLANVQRASDLAPVAPVRVLATRAMGGWERLLPKLASALDVDGSLLVWTGDSVDEVARRVAWRRYLRLGERRWTSLDRGRIVRFVRALDFE